MPEERSARKFTLVAAQVCVLNMILHLQPKRNKIVVYYFLLQEPYNGHLELKRYYHELSSF